MTPRLSFFWNGISMPATLVPAISHIAAPAPSPSRLPCARSAGFAILCLASLGIVYGDIGTSPLYAVRECFQGEHGVGVSVANVLGVLSLIFWTIVVVVTLKYHVYSSSGQPRRRRHPRAHGPGPRQSRRTRELALAARPVRRGAPLRRRSAHAGHLGAGRHRGLEVATPIFAPYVVPLASPSWSGSSSSSGAGPPASVPCSGRSRCCGSS